MLILEALDYYYLVVLPRPHKSAATPVLLGALIYENASLQVEHLVADMESVASLEI